MTTSNLEQKISVLMVVAHLPPLGLGGAEIQAMRLSKQLQTRNIDIKIVTWGKIWHKRKGKIDGLRFHRLHSPWNVILDLPSLVKPSDSGRSAGAVKIEYDDSETENNKVTGKVNLAMRLRYTLFTIDLFLFLFWRRKQIDIIHVHAMEWPAFVAVRVGKWFNKPVLLKDSTMNGIFNLTRYPSGKNKQRAVVNNAHFVAMTRVISANLTSAGVPPERLTIIPNGIGITPPVSRPNWSKSVIFVGNLTQQPAKGVDILLKAWKHVIDAVPGATLTIVGKGFNVDYENYVRRLGIHSSVIFLGSRTDVKELLCKTDIFVLPSRREGMSNALMEAMLAGMPIVATDISGNQDLIEHNVSGVLVPPIDTNKLSEALIRLLLDEKEARSFGTAAYQRVTSICDIGKVAKRYHDKYIDILSGQ